MALRVLLVGLVACLGFEPPSGAEFDHWKESGRDWVAARVAELSSLRVEAERALAGTAERGPVEVVAAVEAGSSRVDLAFEAAVEGMIAGFSADLASIKSRPTVEDMVATVEPEGEMEMEADPAPAVVEGPAAPASRLERISTAVRLTRQAVDAWASLIQPAADDGRGDSL